MGVGLLEFAVCMQHSLLGPPNKGDLCVLKVVYIFVLIHQQHK
jgi:hypothetical protein